MKLDHLVLELISIDDKNYELVENFREKNGKEQTKKTEC